MKKDDADGVLVKLITSCQPDKPHSQQASRQERERRDEERSERVKASSPERAGFVAVGLTHDPERASILLRLTHDSGTGHTHERREAIMFCLSRIPRSVLRVARARRIARRMA